ncbi:hypothetical protein OSB04_006819 [Centaurea solstitialis]|uniref:Uncharacterized protein n=1 Tax=Centaurea solstitialis TaxID=347529 RepID=A0AA38TIN0_9ASTR|nr:hypothetical protein OSB04_006818 [Centaurea solstitialis]KAJ9561659.1 hypothetical protein OSB04_006819 [Centaurea solstitialis]
MKCVDSKSKINSHTSLCGTRDLLEHPINPHGSQTGPKSSPKPRSINQVSFSRRINNNVLKTHDNGTSMSPACARLEGNDTPPVHVSRRNVTLQCMFRGGTLTGNVLSPHNKVVVIILCSVELFGPRGSNRLALVFEPFIPRG